MIRLATAVTAIYLTKMRYAQKFGHLPRNGGSIRKGVLKGRRGKGRL
jgi:hypothetical protein